jgi:hypothetical protein
MSFVADSFRVPFKGGVEFGRGVSGLEVRNGFVQGVCV